MCSLPPPSPKRSRFAAVGEPDAKPNTKPVSKTSQTHSGNKGNTPKKASITQIPSMLTKASLNSLNKPKYAHNPAFIPIPPYLIPSLLPDAKHLHPKRETIMNPSRNLRLELFDEQKNNEFNTCGNNPTVANWSLTGHFVSGVIDGSVWVGG